MGLVMNFGLEKLLCCACCYPESLQRSTSSILSTSISVSTSFGAVNAATRSCSQIHNRLSPSAPCSCRKPRDSLSSAPSTGPVGVQNERQASATGTQGHQSHSGLQASRGLGLRVCKAGGKKRDIRLPMAGRNPDQSQPTAPTSPSPPPHPHPTSNSFSSTPASVKRSLIL